jgi:hypothetical protein
MNLKMTQSEGKKNAPQSDARSQSALAVRTPGRGAAPPLLRLQQTHGNRFAQRLLALARKAEGQAEASPDIENAIQSARGNGRALDNNIRARMEEAFGASFAGVRIHTDAEAITLNRALNARAFTVGRDIFFSHGEYDPGNASGRELLAHELTHVLQQGGAGIQCALPANHPGDVAAAPTTPIAGAALPRLAQRESVQRLCQECEEESHGQMAGRRIFQPKLMIGQPDDPYEREADSMARAVMQWEARAGQGVDRESAGEKKDAELHNGEAGNGGVNYVPPKVINGVKGDQIGRLIQRTPAPGSNFGTYRYCGFGITTYIPGFIKGLFTGSFDVDYTGCAWVLGNAWDSVWELYDASDTKMDSNEESPFGDYTIEANKINSGTPGDGSAKWSLWYRITKSQPWLTDDDDAYPYHYVEFPVYSAPIRDPNTQLKQEVGEVIWQDNFTPAEDGASLQYNFSVTASRTTTDSQTTSVSGTVGGERSSNISFEYEGLSGGFSNRLSYSATASLSRTHSVTVNTSQTTSKTFNQPNLRGGVTYKVVARPLYHIIDGSVGLIKHRDGVITGRGDTISGSIRVLKGMDISVETGAEAAAKRRWSCDASCNVEGTEPHCTGRVTGHSSGHSSEEEACREAKRDATQKAPSKCYARHCRCFNCAKG